MVKILLKLYFYFFLIPTLLFPTLGTSLLAKENSLEVFKSSHTFVSFRAERLGEVISFSTKIKLTKKELELGVSPKSQVTVKIDQGQEGKVKEGDTFSIVSDKNLLLAKFKAAIVFCDPGLGVMMIGYGDFSKCSLGDRLVAEEGNSLREKSFYYKAEGDYYSELNQKGEAICSYKRAIRLNRKNAGAHFNLGKIYLEEGLKDFAYQEFRLAYKNISFLKDDDDQRDLLVLLGKAKKSKRKKGYRGKNYKKNSKRFKIYSGRQKRVLSRKSLRRKAKVFFPKIKKIKRTKSYNRKNI